MMLFAPQEKSIVFMSRQSPKPLDFALLEPVIKKRFPDYSVFWACTKKAGRLSISTLLKQSALAATAELVITDGYIPSISICAGMHRAKCVQIWHALGAIKKFGRQSLNTVAGHDSAIAEILMMHKGYDRIIGGFAGAKEAFLSAFGYSSCDIDIVGLPRVQYLVNRKNSIGESNLMTDACLPNVLKKILKKKKQGKRILLYAPTFRKDPSLETDWMVSEVENLMQYINFNESLLVVSGHPLQNNKELRPSISDLVYLGNVRALDSLCLVDVLITDYSAIAFEAYVSQVPVVFYVPDIDRYKLSPGLNIDPQIEFPDVSSTNAQQAMQIVNKTLSSHGCNESSFEVFMKRYAGDIDIDSVHRICESLNDLLLFDRLDRNEC